MNTCLIVFVLIAILITTSGFRIRRQQPIMVDPAATDQTVSAETTTPPDDASNTTPVTDISPSSAETMTTPTAVIEIPTTTPSPTTTTTQITTSTRTPRDRIIDDGKSDPDDGDQ